MIPHDDITAWRAHAPWVDDAQVEQDLVISRALVAIFSEPHLAKTLAFRGGTALYKLYLTPAARYSEDIDLVQVSGEQAGETLDALRAMLDPWLGTPRWKQTQGGITFTYRFASEDTPSVPLRLKVEINTREHFAVFGYARVPFAVASRWFDGTVDVVTFDLDELLGTKLRALYQRKKGRDLFDLALALDDPRTSAERVVESFSAYMTHGGHRLRRADLEANLQAKMADPGFTADLGPLLAGGRSWDPGRAMERVLEDLVARLPERL